MLSKLEPIKVIKEFGKNITKVRLRFIIDKSIDVLVYGDPIEIDEIQSDFESFNPIEQRAYLNAVLTERLSK